MSDHKDRVFMGVAFKIGELSTCDRARAGAVLTRGGRCISWGYNGAPPGLPHCDENMHGWDTSLEPERELKLSGCQNATHAEANAIAFAARQGISTAGGTLYVTLSPCVICARLIVAAGIGRVFWAEQYRDGRGRLLLTKANIETGVILPG